MTVIAIDPETGLPLPPQAEGPVVLANGPSSPIGDAARDSSSSSAPDGLPPELAAFPPDALAFLEGIFEGLDKRIDALEHSSSSGEGDDQRARVDEMAKATGHAMTGIGQRLQSIEDKLGNVLERIEALESLDAAAKEAATHGKRSGK